MTVTSRLKTCADSLYCNGSALQGLPPFRSIRRARFQPQALPVHRHRLRPRLFPVSPRPVCSSIPHPPRTPLKCSCASVCSLSGSSVWCPRARDPSCTAHRTDVSDFHSVPSHPVELYRACWLYHVTHSNPPPCTVTLVDPVPALLVFLAVLTTPLSIDIMNISVPDPTRSPDVIDTRLVPRNDAWCRQRTDESDSHAVASHAVLRALAAREYLRDPSPAPCTVRLDDPVEARFNTPVIALTDP